MAQKLSEISQDKLRLMLFRFDEDALIKLYGDIHETIKGADFVGDEPKFLDLTTKKQIVVTEMVRKGYLKQSDNTEWMEFQRKIKNKRVY